MRRVLEWVVRHPTVVNLAMVGICLLGLSSLRSLPKEVFPDTALDMLVVKVVFRGGGPEEVEKGIVLKIEESLQGISGIEKISAEARENIAVVRLQLARGARGETVLREVKDQIEQIATFPAAAEKPLVYAVVRRVPVLTFALYGNASRQALQELAERAKEDLLARPQITQVSLGGLKERELVVEVREAALRSYGLQIQDVARAVQQANLDLSGGTLRTPREDLILRAYGKRYHARDIERIVVRAVPGGTPIRLHHVARVRERFAEGAPAFFYQGQPAVQILLQRTASENALEIARQARAYRTQLNKQLPAGVRLDVYQDRTVALRDRLRLLTTNGLQGLALVLIALSFLLSLRLAFWVAAGLPLSLLGTFAVMQWTGLSINMISLFGLIVVLGILVDDAIVVGENIYAHYEKGASPWRAAIDGAREVFPVVFASIITTVLAFGLLFFLGGMLGAFVYMIPAVVIAALMLSLIEAFLILPPHLAHSLKPRTSAEYTQGRFQRIFSGAFRWLQEVFYARLLRLSLRYRWPVIVGSLFLLVLSLSLLTHGIVRYVFFPRVDADRLVARFTLPPGTPRSTTRQLAQRLENSARQLNKQLQRQYGQQMIVATARWIGQQSVRSLDFSPPTGDEVGEVQLELLPGQKRKLSSFVLLKRWRKQTGAQSQARELAFDSQGAGPVGRALEFHLLSSDQAQLRQAARGLKTALARIPGVSDAEDDLLPGKRELRLKLTPLAHSLGVTFHEVAQALRHRFYGQEVMRLQRNKDELRLFVRYSPGERSRLAILDQIWVRTRSGQRPLSQLVTWKQARSLKVIRRINRQRMATVTAVLDDTQTSRGEVLTLLQQKTFPQLARLAPHVRLVSAGQGKEQARVFTEIKTTFPIVLFVIFFVLVCVFRSYPQSLLVMSMIPFGLIGAIGGHLLLGIPFTILSLFGVLALSGILVNDSLVWMDRLNKEINRGIPLEEALVQAGQARLRAILSTTITTVLGLAPLLLERSLQAQILIPMATSMAFGLLFATFLTLVLLPSLFLATNDLRRLARWLWKGVWLSPEEVEPSSPLQESTQTVPTPAANHPTPAM